MIIDNVLARYYSEVQAALHALLNSSSGSHSTGFTPGADLPELTPAMREYLSVSELSFQSMPSYCGRQLSLLDLTRNPGTRTTKTLASLVMVARAIRFVQDTGQRVTLVTPSSANKAVALRDAVMRAIQCGLVAADQLNIVAIVPAGSIHKLRSSALFTEPELRVRNPIAVYDGPLPEQVKTIASDALERHRSTLERGGKANLWYTLKLENYLSADVVRALAEAEFFPSTSDRPRLHAHAVSSAYGLLGHDYGRQMLGPRASGLPSRYFLVQHLGAPDMVVSLYHHAEDWRVPTYSYDNSAGTFTQTENPRFPGVTFEPGEVLDATFYTRNPATSARMTGLIKSQGGGGIVVSLAECLGRYGQMRSLLHEAGVSVPANPTMLFEWSLIMAITGVLNAIDRGLVPEEDIVIHGSGIYSRHHSDGLAGHDLHRVDGADALRDVILTATTP